MNHHQTIPASDLGLPDHVGLPDLSVDEAYRILATKVRRGWTICAVLSATAIAGALVAVVIYHSAPWAVLGIIGGIALKVGATLSQRKLVHARRIAVEPRLLYWAHPRRSTVRGCEVLLTLHARTGQSLEVAMSRDQMLGVVWWLRQHNADVRCGAYDDAAKSRTEPNA